MRVVTLEEHRRIDKLYHGIKFPLFICYSTEEFNECNKEAISPPKVISTLDDMLKFIQEYPRNETHYIQDKNVWIATNEVYKPDLWMNGVILYQTDEQGSPVPTDNCYVQFVSFNIVTNRILVATSSGIFMLGLFGKWITAAKKENFDVVSLNPTTNSPANRLKKLEKLLKRKTLSAGDIRFVYYLMLPMSPYKSIYEAAHGAYGGWITKEYVNKLLNSERIKQAIIKEIRKMIPNFDEILQKIYPLDELASDMKKMVQKTLDVDSSKYNVDATRKALKTIFEALNAEAMISPFQANPLVPGAKVSMVSGNEEAIKSIPKLHKIQNEDIENFEKETGTPLSEGFRSYIDIKE